ncbi:OC116 protein, partial [Zapornia atra]|nr:OC116 protein [Zapornia atra]
CLCLCLLNTALSTPVRGCGLGYLLPHQILLKGCDGKHGLYMFRYFYAYSTLSNQTQIK